MRRYGLERGLIGLWDIHCATREGYCRTLDGLQLGCLSPGRFGGRFQAVARAQRWRMTGRLAGALLAAGEQKSVRMPVGAPATPGRAAGRVSCATGASARLTLLGLVRCTGETGRPGHVRGLPRLTSGPEAASELGAAGSGVDIQCCSAPPFLRCGSNLSSSHQLISMKLGTMFASRCSRLVASRTAVPLTAYLSRVGRPYSTARPAYENILTETPKPGVGLSKYTNYSP